MSYINLEDDSGSMELMAFQRALDTGGMYVKDNAPIIVKGRISARDEKEPQLMVDSIRPIDDAKVLSGEAPPPREPKLWVKLKTAEDPVLKRIQLILNMFPGKQQIIIYCEREKKRIGTSCIIHEALVEELKDLLGAENVVIK